MSHGIVVWLCDLDGERLDRWATSLASTRPEQLLTEAHAQRAGGCEYPQDVVTVYVTSRVAKYWEA